MMRDIFSAHQNKVGNNDRKREHNIISSRKSINYFS